MFLLPRHVERSTFYVLLLSLVVLVSLHTGDCCDYTFVVLLTSAYLVKRKDDWVSVGNFGGKEKDWEGKSLGLP